MCGACSRATAADSTVKPLEKFVIAGTPEEVAEHARAPYDAGAHRVEFGTPQGLPTRHGVELLCRRVVPLLRR